MHMKPNFIVRFAMLALAIPLLLVAGNAGAATVYNYDGAQHDATGVTNQWTAPETYCTAPPKDPVTESEWDGVSFAGAAGYIPNATKRADLTAATCATVSATGSGVIPVAANNAVKNNAAFQSAAACQAAGYRWKVNDPSQPLSYVTGTNYCNGAAAWTSDDPTKGNAAIQWYTLGNEACLRCHNSTFMTTANGHNPDAAKESYLQGGHRNMSRPADGLPWGIPGVDSTHAASSSLDFLTINAILDPNGFFTRLWLQEDYPMMAVNWTDKTKSTKYCALPGTAKDSSGNFRTGQTYGLDDSKAGYETPILGDAGWGYPLSYQNPTDCTTAFYCNVSNYNANSAGCTAAKSQSPVSKGGLANGQVAYNYNSVGSVNVCIDPTVANASDCTNPAYGNAGETREWVTAGFQWYDASVNNSGYKDPLFWIYGGAGLEGGTGMMQPGTQYYWCARCHTTGWTTSGASTWSDNSKLPYSAFGYCSDGVSPNYAACTANSGTWTTAPELFGSAVGGGNKLLAAGMTNGGVNTTNEAWDQWGIECSRCHNAYNGSHANWPSVGAAGAANKTTGGDVVALCMNCHRQEDIKDGQRGQPKKLDGIGTGTGSNQVAKNMAAVWSQRINQPDGFWHHPDGNEFLNSPHSQFTGTWSQIGCPPITVDTYAPYNGNGCTADGTTGLMNYDGNQASSLYQSKFAQAVVSDLSNTSSTAGGCTSCHDVHKPHNENTAGMGGASAMKAACTDCHSRGAGVSPQVDLSGLNHPAGAGTPLEKIGTDPSSACSICHQPPAIKHIWRINTDPTYSTYAVPFGTNGAYNGANPSNTAPDANGRDAVWVDIDSACGQCHGGGTNSTTGLPDERAYPRERAAYFDGLNSAVTPSAPYMTKLQLAQAAKTMHSSDVSSTDCTACHADKVAADGTTHHVVGATPCLTCHTGRLHSGVLPAGGQINPTYSGGLDTPGTGCLYCHGPSGLAAQNNIVPDGASDNHHSDHGICTQCHGAYGGQFPNNAGKSLATDGNDFCLTCHSNTGTYGRHHAVAALKPAGKNCIDCHGPSGYANAGVPGSPAPATNTACLQCHGSLTFTATNGDTVRMVSQGTNHHNGACITCHKAEPFAKLATGNLSSVGTVTALRPMTNSLTYSTTTNTTSSSYHKYVINDDLMTACLSCHSTAQTRSADSSALAAIVKSGAGDNHHQGHQVVPGQGGNEPNDPGLRCVGCHGSGALSGSLPVDGSATTVTWSITASGLTPTTVVGQHGSWTGGADATSTLCQQCHNQTQSGASQDHHPGACLNCHVPDQPGGPGITSPNTPQTLPTWVNCSECHSGAFGTNPNGPPATHHDVTNATGCSQCHTTAGVKPLTTAGSVATCTDCHTETIAALPAAMQSTFTTCASCHPQGGVIPNLLATCGGCHGTSLSTLTSLAKSLHSGVPTAVFTSAVDLKANFKVNYNASTSVCPTGFTCTYGWEFGDGTSLNSGATKTTSHTFATAGTYTTELTLTSAKTGSVAGLSTVSHAVITKYVTSPAPITINMLAKTTASGFTYAIPSLSAIVTGGSGTVTIKISWGDGSPVQTVTRGVGADSISHVYKNATIGLILPYNFVLGASDSGITISGVTGKFKSIVSKSTKVTVLPYYIAGDVLDNSGTRIAGATVTLKQGTTLRKNATSNAIGQYLFSNVKPELVTGATTSTTPYTISVVKKGYTFTSFTFGAVIDPASTTRIIIKDMTAN